MLATKYIEPLARGLEAEGWAFIQTLMTSSYTGYGISTLDQDAEEIETLVSFLVDKWDSKGVVLIGHSTGTQDIVHYLKKGDKSKAAIKGFILQASVSDREYMATLPWTAKYADVARKLIQEGKADDLLPREANPWAPITARRYNDLVNLGGLDDYFSSDFTGEELSEKLGHVVGIPSQLMFSLEDEYVPPHINKEHLISRLAKAMQTTEIASVKGNHALTEFNPEEQPPPEPAKLMIKFITGLPGV